MVVSLASNINIHSIITNSAYETISTEIKKDMEIVTEYGSSNNNMNTLYLKMTYTTKVNGILKSMMNP